MNLVVMTLKSWQNQMMPKYYYDYFLQRCQALGSDKFVSVLILIKYRLTCIKLEEYIKESIIGICLEHKIIQHKVIKIPKVLI